MDGVAALVQRGALHKAAGAGGAAPRAAVGAAHPGPEVTDLAAAARAVGVGDDGGAPPDGGDRVPCAFLFDDPNAVSHTGRG